MRHVRIDFAGQFDEPGLFAPFAGQPGQIERVDGNTVTAEAGAGIERLKTKRLRLGGIDHFPDIDSHLVVEHLQLVDEGDVDGSIGVFEDLAGFGDFHAGDANNLHDGMAVHSTGQIATGCIKSTNDFGDC